MLTWLKNVFVGPHVVVFIGIIITGIAEIFRSYAGKNEKVKLQRVGLILLISGLLISGIGGWWAAKEQSNFEKKILGSVTGGDSFCYLFPSRCFGRLNTIDFHLHHKGEYPLYDVSIRVWDQTCLKGIDHGHIFEKHLGYRSKQMTLEEWQKMKEDPGFAVRNKEIEKEINERMRNCLIFQETLGTVTPNTSTNVMVPSLLSCSVPPGVDLSKFSQEYDVSISARNGHYNQKIIIDVQKKRYHVYSKVEKVISSSKRVMLREYESQDSEGFVIKLLK
jgi:hypothetical protein